MQSSVSIQAIRPDLLSDEDLSWLAKLDGVGFAKPSAKELMAEIARGAISLWRVSGEAQGIILLSLTPKALWIDGLVGKNFIRHAEEIRDKLQRIKTNAGKDVIQGATHRPGLVKLYRALGHSPVATIMEA